MTDEPIVLKRLSWWKRALIQACFFIGWPEKANELEERWGVVVTFQVTNTGDAPAKFYAVIHGTKGTENAEEKSKKAER